MHKDAIAPIVGGNTPMHLVELNGHQPGLAAAQQANGVPMRIAAEAALESADGFGTYTSPLGKLRQSKARFRSVSPKQHPERCGRKLFQ